MRRRAVLSVCVTCRRRAGEVEPEDESGETPRPGARLLAALETAGAPEGVTIRPVECLSACDHGCNLALSAPGKWSYVYGRMDPERDVADILEGAARYGESETGLVPWRERPVIFRKRSIARMPPMEDA